jgi:uncharacterized protein YigA (DUF484 family)
MTQQASRPQDDAMETTIAEYLAAHPDFLHRHPELAGELTLPHPAHAKTVSLVERQVSLLREQKLELKHRLQHIAQVARSNEQLLERLQKLILELIDSTDVPSLLQLLDTAMQRDFQADAVTVWLFVATPAGPAIGRDDPRLAPFTRLLEQGRPACGTLQSAQLAALFGETNDVVSGALVPLCEGGSGECLGLLGIGSRDAQRFHSEMGTVFLAHLGAVAARVLRARLAHAP